MMKNLWRFYVERFGISGIVIAETYEEAVDNTEIYLKSQFNDIKKEIKDLLPENICVWHCYSDDDYRSDLPFALAINY